jgi:hypothetical protein
MKELIKPIGFFYVLLWVNLGEIPGLPMAVIQKSHNIKERS